MIAIDIKPLHDLNLIHNIGLHNWVPVNVVLKIRSFLAQILGLGVAVRLNVAFF